MCDQQGQDESIDRYEPGDLPVGTPTSVCFWDWMLRVLPGLLMLLYHGRWLWPPVWSQVGILESGGRGRKVLISGRSALHSRQALGARQTSTAQPEPPYWPSIDGRSLIEQPPLGCVRLACQKHQMQQ